MADTLAPTGPQAGKASVIHIENVAETEGVNGIQADGTKKAPVEGKDDGPEIRRQVEFYFSDENLPSDLHLLQCTNGRENLPVSISRICGFKRMRKYKKKTVAEELRKSAFLEVSDDGKTVKRKVPLAGRCLLDPPEEDDGEIAYDPRTKREIQLPLPVLPQKKKELPPGMTKGMMKPTGFEETFVEAPVTPAEAEEEDALYDADKPFVERIEIAIQRFKQKRRMHEMYSKIFNKWMRFGGVESLPRMFSGLSRADMAEMNAEEIARATASHNVPWDRSDEKHWVVDFTGVAEAFFSNFYPQTYGYAPGQAKTACQVLRSFYNYLMVHSVCPEYNDDLLTARKVCDQAEKELTKVDIASRYLPSAFNEAASTIFGGSSATTYIGNSDWAQGLDIGQDEIGMRVEQARVTFSVGVTILGTDEQFDLIERGLSHIKVLKDEAIGLELVSIEFATGGTKEMYAKQNTEYKRKLTLEPLGKLVCKAWHMDSADEYDLPKDRYPQGKLPTASAEQNYEFWVEDRVLNECFIGMKMDARVRTLEGGITILDEVREAYCSFWRWLPNELWMERHPKEVKFLKKGLEDVIEAEVDGNGEDQKGQEKDEGGDMSDLDD